MKNQVGFDLNGWRDLAVRNWQILPGEGLEFGGPFEFSGGLGGAVVTLDKNSRHPRFLGGVQALLAPHGRGTGWGSVGEVERRNIVANLLVRPEGYIDELAGALSALAPGGKFTGILCIDDTPEMRETAQEALLEALRKAGARRGLLVWRPVLALLGALNNDRISQAEKIGVISHCAQGFSTQVLKLRQDELATPERQKVGRVHPSRLGLETLLAQAFGVIEAILGDKQRRVYSQAAQSAWRLALGEPRRTEVLRAKNSDWDILTPPATLAISDEPPPESIKEHLSDCEVVLFHSHATGHVSEEILKGIEALVPVPVVALQNNVVAIGALEAARRFQNNQPVYFDFLPQISTIVQDRDGARNEDLIPDNARLRAGETYRSQKPANFLLQQGTRSLSIFLKKENVIQARKVTIDLTTPTKESVKVSLGVEQKPASGRARLTLTSEGFSAPLTVDWDNAKNQTEDWQAIISSQQPTLPTLPSRLVLPTSLECWQDQTRSEGLAQMLEGNLLATKINWKDLADKLSSRPVGTYAISSDGELPEHLDRKAKSSLNEISRLAEEDIRERLKGRGSLENHTLRFLTWQFHRCPQWIVAPMIDAMMPEAASHPFRVNSAASTLLLQGIGRTANDPDDQHRVFSLLFDVPLERWNKNHLACAAFLLSRTDSAPRLLSRKNVEFLAQVAALTMQKSIRSNYSSTFIYAPFLLVGLLRWRLKEPSALVSGTDTVASELLRVTEDVIHDLEQGKRSQSKLEKYRKILLDVVEELKGQGVNPNLLLDLESLT